MKMRNSSVVSKSHKSPIIKDVSALHTYCMFSYTNTLINIPNRKITDQSNSLTISTSNRKPNHSLYAISIG